MEAQKGGSRVDTVLDHTRTGIVRQNQVVQAKGALHILISTRRSIRSIGTLELGRENHLGITHRARVVGEANLVELIARTGRTVGIARSCCCGTAHHWSKTTGATGARHELHIGHFGGSGSARLHSGRDGIAQNVIVDSDQSILHSSARERLNHHCDGGRVAQRSGHRVVAHLIHKGIRSHKSRSWSVVDGAISIDCRHTRGRSISDAHTGRLERLSASRIVAQDWNSHLRCVGSAD